MEPKKNPKYDIYRKSGIIFNFSLAISLLLMITAFKWSVQTRGTTACKFESEVSRAEMIVVPVVADKKEPVPAADPVKPPEPKPSHEAIDLKAVSNEKPVEEPPAGFIDQNNSSLTDFTIGSIDVPKEPTDSIFKIVETMPVPEGGWKAFYKTLRENMKYPITARRREAGGKVYVGFTINQKGNPENVAIEKGIGFGCDEEAQRVIALTKWAPGKQRGRPVKVRMVLPVVFSLGKE